VTAGESLTAARDAVDLAASAIADALGAVRSVAHNPPDANPTLEPAG